MYSRYIHRGSTYIALLKSSRTSLPTITSSLSLFGENLRAAIAAIAIKRRRDSARVQRLPHARHLARHMAGESNLVAFSRFQFPVRRLTAYRIGKCSEPLR